MQQVGVFVQRPPAVQESGSCPAAELDQQITPANPEIVLVPKLKIGTVTGLVEVQLYQL